MGLSSTLKISWSNRIFSKYYGMRGLSKKQKSFERVCNLASAIRNYTTNRNLWKKFKTKEKIQMAKDN